MWNRNDRNLFVSLMNVVLGCFWNEKFCMIYNYVYYSLFKEICFWKSSICMLQTVLEVFVKKVIKSDWLIEKNSTFLRELDAAFCLKCLGCQNIFYECAEPTACRCALRVIQIAMSFAQRICTITLSFFLETRNESAWNFEINFEQ